MGMAEEAAEAASGETGEADATGDEERGRRRRRRRRSRRDERRDEGRERPPAAAQNSEDEETASEPEYAHHEDGEHRQNEEGDGDRKRRRRGRRGGRSRGRREGDEAVTPIAAAAETIEILPSPSPEDATREPPEFEPPDFAAPVPWAAETGMETASLAPFAGDEAAAEPHPPTLAAEPEIAPAPVAEAEPGIPFVSEAERALEMENTEAHSGNGDAQQGPEPTRHVSSVPDDVRAVTDKPANPRRGWWQRLTQS
jgi:ribonuclease E